MDAQRKLDVSVLTMHLAMNFLLLFIAKVGNVVSGNLVAHIVAKSGNYVSSWSL